MHTSCSYAALRCLPLTSAGLSEQAPSGYSAQLEKVHGMLSLSLFAVTGSFVLALCYHYAMQCSARCHSLHRVKQGFLTDFRRSLLFFQGSPPR